VYDFAIVSVAAAGQIENGVWQDGRIVLGGVAPTPYRAIEAENVLRGQEITESAARDAAERALLTARPMTENAYKIDIAKNLIRKAVMSLAA
jgi:xanthine dehydrogenase YagS FAD-binding subunit